MNKSKGDNFNVKLMSCSALLFICVINHQLVAAFPEGSFAGMLADITVKMSIISIVAVIVLPLVKAVSTVAFSSIFIVNLIQNFMTGGALSSTETLFAQTGWLIAGLSLSGFVTFIIFELESKPSIDPSLFDKRYSNKKKIELFLDCYSNEKFLVLNEFDELLDAEDKMLYSIKEGQTAGLCNEKVRASIASLLKANYPSLLQLNHIYSLEGSSEFLRSKEGGAAVNKALSAYRIVTTDIDNLLKIVDEVKAAEDDEARRRDEEIESERMAKDAEIKKENHLAIKEIIKFI